MRASRLSWLLPALAVLAMAPQAEATPVCTAPARLMQWPTLNPVWEFCFLTPSQSTGPNRAGLELTDVYYKGHLVLKRAHAPILNVLYEPGGCGCYRDWSWEEVRFEVINASGPVSGGSGSYAEATQPPRTVCDVGGSFGDLGSFRGVAAEKLSDELILTTQFRAGWYRYLMKWRLSLDGRIETEFGFGAVSASCIAFGHTHHNYWRLDFDIDGAASDHVGFELPPGPPRGGHIPQMTLEVEKMAKLIDPRPLDGVPLIVQDAVTGRGYRILAEKAAFAQRADTFAVGDVWVTRYNANQISDDGSAGCATSLNNYVNGESVYNQDVVVWVRGGAFHEASDLDDCHRTSIVLEPVGNWNP
jgi:hypothetical protein